VALREVRVGVWAYPPQVSVDADDRPTGIFVDIVEAVGAENGWQITYVDGTWEDTLARLRGGEIDLGLGVGQVALRRAEFDLTDEPVVSDWGQIFTREGDRIETVLDLEGKTVVGWKSDRTYRSLSIWPGSSGWRPSIWQRTPSPRTSPWSPTDAQTLWSSCGSPAAPTPSSSGSSPVP
jgi:ABC-type amino acid transport substrate-binding protein